MRRSPAVRSDAEDGPLCAELGEEVVRALDRAEGDLGEEQDAREEAAEVRLGALPAPVDLEVVTDDLERVVRDAEGEHDRARVQGGAEARERAEAVHAVDEEALVLEPAEEAQVEEEREPEHARAPRRLGPSLDAEPGRVVDGRHDDGCGGGEGARVREEAEAEGHQHRPPVPRRRGVVGERRDREEDEVRERAEVHGQL